MDAENGLLLADLGAVARANTKIGSVCLMWSSQNQHGHGFVTVPRCGPRRDDHSHEAPR